MTTTKSELNKSHAQLSLRVLENYVGSILEPHWDKKAKGTADLQAKRLYFIRSLKARTALIDLRHEIERMPE